MNIFINNSNGTLWLCLNVLRWVGFLVPDDLTGISKKIYPFYFFFSFMFVVGIYVVTQTGALFQEWGNMSEMTEISCLLFTNLAFTCKILNVMLRRKAVLHIIDEGDYELRSERRPEGIEIVKNSNKETTRLLALYSCFTTTTVLGWAVSAEKNQLPLRAWYPFDTSKFPIYEIMYFYQSIAVIMLAVVNVSLDQLVTSLTAVCCCRLRLVNLSLRTLCEDIVIGDALMPFEDEEVVKTRLRRSMLQHQAALQSAADIQTCFTVPLLVQFTVSMVIICVTAYQLAVETNNSNIRVIAMSAYLMGMTLQVFLYCYQAHRLSEESSLTSDAAYSCPWYAGSTSLRRTLLVVMVRSRQLAVITAGGFTTLSLDCFVSIIKASYSFFTVLQQMEE